MTPSILTLLFGLAGILASVLIVAPLARLLPKAVMQEWEDHMADGLDVRANPVPVADFVLSRSLQSLLLLASACLCLMASAYGGSLIDAAYFSFYFLGLLLLVAINLKHQLLLDMPVYILMWVGLLRGVGTEHLPGYVLGAVAGYLVPRLLNTFVRIKSGKDVMGNGDMKTFAMAGAWFGLASLPLLFAAFFVSGFVFSICVAARGIKGNVPTGFMHLAGSLSCFLWPVLQH
ncbi:MAG: prepilin peptidase [Massilia sp.]